MDRFFTYKCEAVGQRLLKLAVHNCRHYQRILPALSYCHPSKSPKHGRTAFRYVLILLNNTYFSFNSVRNLSKDHTHSDHAKRGN